MYPLRFKLPNSPGPNGENLPPGWRHIPEHNGSERWVSPDGKEGLDFDRGVPGRPQFGGKDGWHKLKPRPDRDKRWDRDKSGGRKGGHYLPRDEVELDSYKKFCPPRPYPPGPLMEELRMREKADRHMEKVWRAIIDGGLMIITRRFPTTAPWPGFGRAPVPQPAFQ